MSLFGFIEAKLLKAIHARKTSDCLEIMKNKYDPNKLVRAKKGWNTTLLIEATDKGLWAVMKKLIEDGADLNYQRKMDLKAALHFAGSLKSAYILLSNGAYGSPIATEFLSPGIQAKKMKEYWIEKYKSEWAQDYADIESICNNWMILKSPPYSFTSEIERKEKLFSKCENKIKKLFDSSDEISKSNIYEVTEIQGLIGTINNWTKYNNEWDDVNEKWSREYGENVKEIVLNPYTARVNVIDSNSKNGDLFKRFNEFILRQAPAYFYLRALQCYEDDDMDDYVSYLQNVQTEFQLDNEVIPILHIKNKLLQYYTVNNENENALKELLFILKEEKALGIVDSTDNISQKNFSSYASLFIKTKNWKEGLKWVNSIKNNELNKDKFMVDCLKQLNKWEDLGRYYEKSADFNMAIKYYKKAGNSKKLLKLNKESGNHSEMAALQEKGGDFKEAALNYFKAKLYNDSRRLYLKLKDIEMYFESLSKSKLTELSELNSFPLEEIIDKGVKYSLLELISDYVISHKYNELNESHIGIIQPLYSSLLSMETKNTKVRNAIFLLSVKFGVEDQILKAVNDIFLKKYTELLDGELTEEKSKDQIEKLLQLNGYRLLTEIENTDYLNVQSKLFDEFRLLSMDNYDGYENILKYKVASFSFSNNWDSMNAHLSLIASLPESSRYGNLLKILIENLLDNSKDKGDSLNQFWRYAQKEIPAISISSLDSLDESLYGLQELQPEYLVYQYWMKTFFTEQQTSNKFSEDYNDLINAVNITVNNSTEENLSILLNKFLDFYNNNTSDFKNRIESSEQIELLSKICQLFELFDVTLHNNLIGILEKEYDYEYGL